MVRLASRLCVKWLRGRFVFLARTLLLRLAGLPGRMAGRQRNRWGRFGFVWLGVAGFGEAAVDGGAGGPGGPNFAASSGVDLIAEGELFSGDRDAVRRASVKRALELVLRLD
jgi:hypothetical protein